MTKHEAAYILDPATTRDALRPYAYDCERRFSVVEEACALAAKVLREAAEKDGDEIQKIADYYGLEGQLNQTQEECAELIQSISKYRRAGGLGQPVHCDRVPLADLSEEMADVEIMLKQLRYLLGNGGLVDEIIGQKLARQLRRMAAEKGGAE